MNKIRSAMKTLRNQLFKKRSGSYTFSTRNTDFPGFIDSLISQFADKMRDKKDSDDYARLLSFDSIDSFQEIGRPLNDTHSDAHYYREKDFNYYLKMTLTKGLCLVLSDSFESSKN